MPARRTTAPMQPQLALTGATAIARAAAAALTNALPAGT
jgi:hypothetical protein